MNQFNAVRATAEGGAGNPEGAEANVSNFMQCVHDVTKHSKANCAASYTQAF